MTLKMFQIKYRNQFFFISKNKSLSKSIFFFLQLVCKTDYLSKKKKKLIKLLITLNLVLI